MAKTAYTIDYAEGVGQDLANLRAYERKNILDTITRNYYTSQRDKPKAKRFLST